MLSQVQKQLRSVVVVNYNGDNIALLLPVLVESGKPTYVNLLTSNIWNDDHLKEDVVTWIIRPGDQAQFDEAFTGIYRGIKLSLDHIIYLSDEDSGIKIQPVPVEPTPDPEKDLRERIEVAERFLNLAKNALR